MNFDISDAFGNGWVYYCFVKEGENVPTKGTSSPWEFLKIGGETTTAVLSVDKGDSFVGKLYYYTVDDQDNDSYVENGNKYYSEDIVIYNDEALGYIEIEDMTKGLDRYNISFDDNKGQDKLEYKWIDKNAEKSGFVQENYIEYIEGTHDIGAAVHTGDDGEDYLFDGTYELEYKVINKQSGNYVERSYTFVFDNSNPAIELPVWTNGKKIRETQQAEIKITDKGAIESAYYQVVNIDNSDIGFEPVPLPVDNDGSVNAVINVTVPETIGSGIYALKIHAEDINGNYSTVGFNYLDETLGKVSNGKKQSDYNDTAMRFAVRTGKPNLELVSVSGNTMECVYENVYRTGQSEDYTIKLRAEEFMRNIGDLNYNTYLKYQTSSDGINWSDW